MTGRGALVVCVAVLLGGCTLEVPFDCSWNLGVAAPPGVAATAVPLDLAGQEALWARRDAVEELRLDRVRLTVAGVGPHDHADSVTMGLRYRAEGAPDSGELDVAVLERADLPLIPGASVELIPPPALGAALEAALRGSGRFTLLLESEADGVVEAAIVLSLAGTVVATP